MAKDIIGALRVTLGFDTTQFEHGSRRARETIRRDTQAIKSDLSGVRAAIGGLAGAFIGIEAIRATRRALDYASSLGGIAREADVTTRELQIYRYAATQTDLTQQEMDSSLKRLTKSIGEAKAGTKAQATVFRDLGVAIQDANGRVYSAGEVIPKLADALARVKDPATRARLEVKLFGEQGQKLDGLLMQGSKGIEMLARRAEELGLIMRDDLAEAADKTNRRLTEIKKTLDTRFATMVAENAEAILGLANALTALTAKAVEYINTYPRLSAALAGATVGSRGGAIGAVLGGGAGFFLGDVAADGKSAGNMDLRFRQQKLREARAELEARRRYAREGGVISFRRASEDTSGGTIADAELELQRQADLAQEAVALWAASQKRKSTLVPDGALPVPNERGRKGPKDRAEEKLQRFHDELAGLYDRQLAAEQSVSNDLRERAMIEHERIERAQEAYETDLKSRVRRGELTMAQAEELRLQQDRNTQLEHQAVNWQLDDEILREEMRVRQEGLDQERESLSIRAGLARTFRERREIQLRMLDRELESARRAAEEVLRRRDSSEIDKQIARARIAQLESIRQDSTLRINRDTMGPLEQYQDSIPKTAAEINEAYEHIAANGIRSMNEGLAGAISRTLRLKGVAGELFNQLISDLIRFQVQQATSGAGGLLSGLLGGVFGGQRVGFAAGIEKMGASNLAALESNFAMPSFDGGGSFEVLGKRGIDRNTLSLNGLPIANVSYGERLSVWPEGSNDNGSRRTQVEVIPSPYFDVRVTEIASPLAERAGMGAVAATESRATKRGNRRVGRR